VSVIRRLGCKLKLPSPPRIRQPGSVVVNHPSGFFALGAAPRQPLAVTARLASPRKTRVRGFPRCASGQTSWQRRCRSIKTLGAREYAYKTVSGRHEWPNRDPIAELGGLNLYAYVANNPVVLVDLFGLDDSNPLIPGFPGITGGPQSIPSWQSTPLYYWLYDVYQDIEKYKPPYYIDPFKFDINPRNQQLSLSCPVGSDRWKATITIDPNLNPNWSKLNFNPGNPGVSLKISGPALGGATTPVISTGNNDGRGGWDVRVGISIGK
jgi:RHS repeat-associated protein